MLSVSAWSRCFLFDMDTHEITPHDLLPRAYSVKSLDISRQTGRLAYVRAESPNWWSDDIHLLDPSGKVTLPGERIYKARWNY
jgi:hypothetical protein